MRLPLVLLLLTLGCGVTEVVDRADDGRAILIRSPQPDEDDLRDLHTEHGIRTVFNLRGEHPGRDWFDEEERGVAAIGARWEHLGLSGRKAPKPEELTMILDLLEDPTAWPILIHCQGGVHRTGLVAALYRIQYQGWDPERAVGEMEDLGFNWTLDDREGVKEFLRAYARDEARGIDRSE
jgi:protein tyrosine/serine phosphatase